MFLDLQIHRPFLTTVKLRNLIDYRKNTRTGTPFVPHNTAISNEVGESVVACYM